MSTSTSDLLAASERLDPPNRALMNLWLRRQLDDVEIARLSGGTPEEIAVRRERLLEALAQEVDVPTAEVRAALAQLQDAPQGPVAVEREAAAGAVLVETAATAPPAPPGPAPPSQVVLPPPGVEAPTEPAPPAPAPPPAPEAPAAKPPAAAPLPSSLLVALGVCLVAMIALAAFIGGGEDPAPPRDEAAAQGGEPRGPAPAPVQPPAGGSAGGAGTLTVEGDRMVVSVAGLQRPSSDYVVWLFNSQADAEPLGRLDELSFPIRPGTERFQYVDVSQETDDDPGHSGLSVARMPAPSAGE